MSTPLLKNSLNMKKNIFEKIARLGLPVVLSVLLVAVGASAATTISTNITTGGTLSVTGASTLTALSTHVAGFVSQASSTVVGAFTTTGANVFGGTLTLGNGETIANSTDGTISLGAATTSMTGATMSNGFISSASSTVAGNLTVTGTFSPAQTSASVFTVTGLTTMNGGASTTNLSASGILWVGGRATTTGSTGNIETAGTLSVTGLTTNVAGFVSQASSTVVSTLSVGGDLYASSTLVADGIVTLGGGYGNTGVSISAAGVIQANGALTIDGVSTLSGNTILSTASSTGLTKMMNASTTALSIGTGNGGNTIKGLVFGTCTVGSTAIVASSTANAVCTVLTGSVDTSHGVIVQAVGRTAALNSLPADVIVRAASSTSGTEIGIEFYNTNLSSGGTQTVNGQVFTFMGIK